MPVHLPNLSEKELQAQIIELLEYMGFIVLKASVSIRSTNPRHHQTGQSPGIPDILISHRKWPIGTWVGLEVKKPEGWRWSCDEQRSLWEAGRTYKVHSIEDAKKAAEEAHETLRNAHG